MDIFAYLAAEIKQGVISNGLHSELLLVNSCVGRLRRNVLPLEGLEILFDMTDILLHAV